MDCKSFVFCERHEDRSRHFSKGRIDAFKRVPDKTLRYLHMKNYPDWFPAISEPSGGEEGDSDTQNISEAGDPDGFNKNNEGVTSGTSIAKNLIAAKAGAKKQRYYLVYFPFFSSLINPNDNQKMNRCQTRSLDFGFHIWGDCILTSFCENWMSTGFLSGATVRVLTTII